MFIGSYRHLICDDAQFNRVDSRNLGRRSMTLAVYRGDGKREGSHSIPRRQVPNAGVRFSGLGTHGETVGFRPVQAVRGAPAKVRCGSDAVLSPWSLNPVSFLNRTLGSVTTGPPFPTEQPLAVRPQLSRGVHVAIQRLPADAELDA